MCTSSIHHHHPALLRRRVLILDPLLTFLVVSSALVLKLFLGSQCSAVAMCCSAHLTDNRCRFLPTSLVYPKTFHIQSVSSNLAVVFQILRLFISNIF